MTLILELDAPSAVAPVLPGASLLRARRLHTVRGALEAPPGPAAEVGESALLAGLRAGDGAAYETLVRRHGPRMLAVARGYLPSEEDSEDVLQSAFLLVVRFVHRFEGESKLSTWLHRIVVNCALMKIRSRKRHPETRLSASASEDGYVAEVAAHPGVSVADELVRRETHDRLLVAVGSLPEKCRSAVRLRDVEGLSLAQTARLLGRSLAAVKTSVHSGRVALRAVLAPAVEVLELR